DILGVPVVRPQVAETTALGAAYAAGLAQGFWSNLEDLRAVAQNFTAQPNSVFVATLRDPPSVLLAASVDSGVDAGQLLKAALSGAGGRGGGNARIAQGSVPDASSLDALVAKLSED
ncbi:MAG: DHHA1 domain-containing protein, partial [Candidatus Solibacter sp.]|nr:DHHA1 domain-containing protein [Candidatus Solibacter sp.]